MIKQLDDIEILILAGGFGTRLKEVTKNIPKCLVEVSGKPFLYWLIEYFKKQGFLNITISTGYLSTQVIDYIHNEYNQTDNPEINITCIVEPEPLGTGGAIKYCANNRKEPKKFLIANGDTLLLSNYSVMLNMLIDNGSDGVILGLNRRGSNKYGRMLVTSDNKLKSFDEKSSETGLINGGIYLLKRELIESFPDGNVLSFEKDVIPYLLGKNKNFYVHSLEQIPFIDIGTPSSLLRADKFIEENIRS